MIDTVARAVALFIAPPPGPLAAPRRAGPTAVAVRAIVLGDATTALPVGAALANELRIATRARAALVCAWTPAAAAEARVDEVRDTGTSAGLAGPPALGPPALGTSAAARRLAARLAPHGFAIAARGRLAWLPLPAGPEAATAALACASAVIAEPIVIAVAGARPAAFDAVLDDVDLIALAPPAGAPEPLVELALAELAAKPAAVLVRRAALGGAAGRLALHGRGRLRGEKVPIHSALRALA